MNARCSKRVAPTRAPDGWTVEAQQEHPRYRLYLEPQAQCELDQGHDGAHRNGGLIWHDPPVLYVGGVQVSS